MQFNININDPLLPRRIGVPIPGAMSIESGMVSTIKTSLYKSILKQIDIYQRMNQEPNPAEWKITGLLNTPVFSDVTLQSSSDTKLKITLDTVLVTVEQSKNIGRTIATGKNGTVKEYYSMDDYNVSLVGSLVDENATKYPVDKMNTLMQLITLPEALKLTGPFMDLFKIYSGVVYNYKFDQKPGLQNTQFFEIKMYSDQPAELEEVN